MKQAECGDSAVDAGETCDGTTGCDASCRCSAGWTPGTTMGNNTCSRCGNLVVDDWREECDDNTTSCVSCKCAAGFLSAGHRCVDLSEGWCAGDASCVWCASTESCMPKELSVTCQECSVFDMSREECSHRSGCSWCPSASTCLPAGKASSCVSCSSLGSGTCDSNPVQRSEHQSGMRRRMRQPRVPQMPHAAF
eukprot:m51a1_g12817 hypothetical protein (194) ;mRNA; f:641-1983